MAAAGRELHGAGPIRHFLGLVDHLEDPLAGRRGSLGLADPHPERPQRHHEHAEVQVERDEAADGELARRHHARADEEDRGLGDHRHPRDERDVEGPLPVGSDRLVEDGLRSRAELALFLRLLCEGLDDVDADDVLLGHRRDVGELLLDLAERGVGDPAVAVGEDDEDRRDRERDQRELPLENE
jgi:hypothetical protein